MEHEPLTWLCVEIRPQHNANAAGLAGVSDHLQAVANKKDILHLMHAPPLTLVWSGMMLVGTM